MNTPSQDSLKMLEALQSAVQQELEKKKRLCHYAVVWIDNKPAFIGEDAPREATDTSQQ